MARTSLSIPFSGARLRGWREQAGLTQQELADICGLSRFQISRWETGDSKPAPGSLKLLVQGLTRTLDDSTFTLTGLLDDSAGLPPVSARCDIGRKPANSL